MFRKIIMSIGLTLLLVLFALLLCVLVDSLSVVGQCILIVLLTAYLCYYIYAYVL